MRCLVPVLCATVLTAASPQSFRMPNGLQVRLVEEHDRPLVRLQFRVTWNPSEVPPGKEGLLGFLARLMAPERMNREAFTSAVEEHALRVSFQPGVRAFTWSILATSQNADPAIEYLAMAVAHPPIDGAAVESVRLQARKESARDRAGETFRRSLGDPTCQSLPGSAELASLQPQDLQRLRRRILRPEGAVLVIEGDMNLEQAKQMASQHFGAWGPGAEPSLVGGAPVMPEIRTWLVEGSPVVIQVGSVPLGEDLRQLAAREIAAWLLRRDAATTGTGVIALETGLEVPLVIQASSGSLEDTLKALKTFLARSRERTWTDFEIARALMTWRELATVKTLHPSQIAEELARMDPETLAVSPEEIRKAVQTWLDPSSLRWLVLGAKAEDAALLDKAGLGSVKVVQ